MKFSQASFMIYIFFKQNYLKMYQVSFPYMMFIEKSRIPLWCIPLLPIPRLYRNLGVIPGLKGSIWLNDLNVSFKIQE